MPASDDVKTIRMKDVVAQNLALRHSADRLFDCIDLLKNTNVIIDFHDVHTASRSFMHQFLRRLERVNNHNIDYINMSENVKRMLDIVKSHKKTPMIVNPKPKRVIRLDSDTSIHNVGEGNFSIQKMDVSSLASLGSFEMRSLTSREENIFRKR